MLFFERQDDPMIRWRMAILAAMTLMPGATPAQVRPQDVAAVNWKITSMRGYFASVWQDFFMNDQPRLYVTPKIVSYSNRVNSACGDLGKDNAFFCPKDNTIYYDQEFLVKRMKAVAAAVQSDGDYAPVVILAHEWGHAAGYWYSRQKRTFSWETYSG